MKIEFEAADDAQRALLRDVGYAMTAYYQGLATGKSGGPVADRYLTGAAAVAVAKNIADAAKSGVRPTGTVVYTKATAQVTGQQTAVVNYCEDSSHAYAKNTTTGAVATTAPSPKDYYAWHVSAKKLPSGDWQIDTATWVQGAKECQQ
ncbi:hypothetical protein [Kitasatospora sp. KL5]|uniref:hypothetical protein n=1 Tax=Kitasatospora sp. KL5 TaxID=3425125 RepID=UPI003D701C8E